MRLRDVSARFGKGILIAGAVAAITLPMTASTSAKPITGLTSAVPQRDEYPQRWMDRDEIARVASDNGYRDGLRAGLRDRDRDRPYDLDSKPLFRSAMSGYRSMFRDPEFYRSNYRDGFRRGYDQGFREGE